MNYSVSCVTIGSCTRKCYLDVSNRTPSCFFLDKKRDKQLGRIIFCRPGCFFLKSKRDKQPGSIIFYEINISSSCRPGCFSFEPKRDKQLGSIIFSR